MRYIVSAAAKYAIFWLKLFNNIKITSIEKSLFYIIFQWVQLFLCFYFQIFILQLYKLLEILIKLTTRFMIVSRKIALTSLWTMHQMRLLHSNFLRVFEPWAVVGVRMGTAAWLEIKITGLDGSLSLNKRFMNSSSLE